MTVIASIPPALLWAASFAASIDGSKGELCSIDLRQQNGLVRIAAVDGYRCFRCHFPASDNYFAPEEPLRVSPKAFSKAPSRKSLIVELHDGDGTNNVACFIDNHKNISSSCLYIADPWALTDKPFPNIEQIWPDDQQLSCKPDGFITVNASYIADFAKVAAKIGDRGHLRMLSADSPHSPIALKSLFCGSWTSAPTIFDKEVWLEYLLMPVQVRDR